ETGLAYHSARYYAPWLGRWASADPLGVKDGPNGYCYVHDRPMRNADPSGTKSAPKPDNDNSPRPQPQHLRVGTEIHKAIAEHYQRTTHHLVISNYFSVGSIVDILTPGLVLDPRRFGKQPDLLDISTSPLRLYEIKPLHRIIDALGEAIAYL